MSIRGTGHLSGGDLNLLREKGIITQNEIAYWAGDILVAENVITNEKRALHEGAKLLNEVASPTLLKG
jgi:hypothetical protein